MYLSHKSTRFLKAIIKIYRRRLRRNEENAVFFRHIHLKNETKLKRFSDNEVEFCLCELKNKQLVERYTDSGFRITSEAVAFYEFENKQPLLRVVWFISGAVFTAFLEFVLLLLEKLLPA